MKDVKFDADKKTVMLFQMRHLTPPPPMTEEEIDQEIESACTFLRDQPTGMVPLSDRQYHALVHAMTEHAHKIPGDLIVML